MNCAPVIAFKYGLTSTDGLGHGVKFHFTSDGGKADTKEEIEINGRRLEASYHMESQSDEARDFLR